MTSNAELNQKQKYILEFLDYQDSVARKKSMDWVFKQTFSTSLKFLTETKMQDTNDLFREN